MAQIYGLGSGESKLSSSLHCSLLPDCRYSVTCCLRLQLPCLLCCDGLYTHTVSQKKSFHSQVVFSQVFCYSNEKNNRFRLLLRTAGSDSPLPWSRKEETTELTSYLWRRPAFASGQIGPVPGIRLCSRGEAGMLDRQFVGPTPDQALDEGQFLSARK